MLSRLYAFVEGYLRLEVKGQFLERIINILLREGFALWDIDCIDDRLYVNIRVKDFKRIRKYLSGKGYIVRIYQRVGVPFIMTKIFNRRVLIIGIIIIILSLYSLSSLVFFIEVEGLKEINQEKIFSFLKEADIKRGVLKKSIDTEALEKAFIKEFPRLSWINIYFSGTKMIVEVVEKKVIEPQPETNDIVANKAGLISKIIVLKGTPMVKEGETVKAGDVLISREVLIKKQGEEVLNREVEEETIPLIKREVNAEGVVKAKIWYEGYGEAELCTEYNQVTTNQKKSLILKYKDKEVILTGPKKPPFRHFKVLERSKSLAKWRNLNIPIELITRRYIQIKKIREERKLDVAKKISKEEAVKSILQQIGKDAIILNTKLKLIELESNDNNIIRVKALVEVEEDIAVRRE